MNLLKWGKLVLFCLPALNIDASALQTVQIGSSAINEIAITTPSGALTINSAVAGALPNDATSSSGAYAITTNGVAMKITGQINSAMPTGLQLQVSLGAPSGGVSQGVQVMSTTPQTLVTSISTLFENNLNITCTLHQVAAVSSLATFTRTLTLTLLQGP